MADEKEEMLEKMLDDLNQQILTLAEKMEAVAGVDCEFGSCVFDPAIDDIETKIEEVERRKKVVEGMLAHLEDCATK